MHPRLLEIERRARFEDDGGHFDGEAYAGYCDYRQQQEQDEAMCQQWDDANFELNEANYE